MPLMAQWRCMHVKVGIVACSMESLVALADTLGLDRQAMEQGDEGRFGTGVGRERGNIARQTDQRFPASVCVSAGAFHSALTLLQHSTAIRHRSVFQAVNMCSDL